MHYQVDSFINIASEWILAWVGYHPEKSDKRWRAKSNPSHGIRFYFQLTETNSIWHWRTLQSEFISSDGNPTVNIGEKMDAKGVTNCSHTLYTATTDLSIVYNLKKDHQWLNLPLKMIQLQINDHLKEKQQMEEDYSRPYAAKPSSYERFIYF